MSSKGNKRARKRLEELCGKGCFIERSGIRNITPEEEEKMRRTIKGFKKLDRTITYHHIKPKSKGGEATVENGANLARYNHDWLEKLPQKRKDEVNNKLQEFKLRFMTLNASDKGINAENINEMSIDSLEDSVVIPLCDNECDRVKFNKEMEDNVL